MIKLKRSLKNEASLRHRTFSRVNEKDNSVNHLKNTLNLAAEVSVAGGVDDVDLDVLVVNGGVLCEDGNSALLFKISRVHNSSYGFLIVSVNTALLEHLVNESGLTVVNVCNNCNISQIVTNHFGYLLFKHTITIYYYITFRQYVKEEK